jgi:hypothetical protein
MTQSSEEVPPQQILRKGYEAADVSVRGLLWFVVIFLLTAAVLHTALWFLLKHYVSVPRVVDAPRSSVPSVTRFIEPNLQPSPNHNALPREDLAQLRWDEAKRFEQLGWNVESDTHSAHIPDSIVAQLVLRYSTAATTQAAGGGQTR